MAVTNSYYTILGVSQYSSSEEITAAYRRMAMKWHPDRHQDKTKIEAERKFKEVKFAYEYLSDCDKKDQYDKSLRTNGANFHSKQDSKSNENNSASWKKTSTPKSRDIHKTITLDLADAINGCKFTYVEERIEQCSECNDTGGNRLRCQICHGTGDKTENRKITSRCGVCDGFGFKTIVCDTCHGKSIKGNPKSTIINIPAGVLNGAKLVIKNKGPFHNGAFGDLIITVKIKQTDSWKYSDSNIYGQISIGFATALLGGPVNIELPTGKKLQITIPPRTNSGKKLRLVGKGLPKPLSSEFGDMTLTVIIRLPEKKLLITPELESMLRMVSD